MSALVHQCISRQHADPAAIREDSQAITPEVGARRQCFDGVEHLIELVDAQDAGPAKRRRIDGIDPRQGSGMRSGRPGG